MRTIALAGVIVASILAVLAVGLRYGVQVPQVRSAIEAKADGLKLGRFGWLGVSGLTGDVLHDLRIAKLTIRDDQGVWLEAHDVHLVWDYPNLLRRRFSAQLVEARLIRVLRRPRLGPAGKPQPMPVSVHIARAQARLLLEPAFSGERGVYGLGMELNLNRHGRRSAQVHAESELQPGDYLDVDFAIGGRRPLRIIADAVEARGGAMAGALGLPSDRPFKLFVRAHGRNAEGRFRARATSGDTVPLAASGAWNRQGGQAGGRVLLTASSLTAPFAERFGRDIRFGLAGRKVSKGVYALDLRASSDAARAHAFGFGDLGERSFGAQGLRVQAEAASLARLTGVTGLGPGRIDGTLKGAFKTASDSWTFASQAVVQDVSASGYRLARISGPVELSHGPKGYAVRARLTGTGGQGAGLAAALLGGAPVAALNAERSASGQLVVRRLDVKGSGLSVELEGGRSLFGASTVHGDVRITNLAAARPDARGAANIGFRASQSREGAAWNVSLDARGDRLATGLAELDRLLGPQPRLQVQGDWLGGRLGVRKAALDGKSLDANASGVMARDRSLDFQVGWSATGPVRAGPVEITGKAKGGGRIGGSVAAPRLDLTADFEKIDAPRMPLSDAHVILTFERRSDGSSGSVSLTGGSPYGPARARSDFRFPEGGVDLTGLDVDAGGVKAQGSLSLRRSSPSAADLRFEIAQGALLDAGRAEGVVRIVDGPGAAQAHLKLQARNARPAGATVTFASADLTADGPLSRLPYAASAQGSSPQGQWRFAGKGVLASADPGYLLSFDGSGKLGRREVRTTEAASFRFGGDVRSARLRLGTNDGGRIALDGVLSGDSADVTARANGVGLSLINQDLDGSFAADVDLHGNGDRLAGTLELRLADARGGGSPAAEGVDGVVHAKLGDGAINLDVDTSNGQGLRANANLMLPAVATAAPFRIAIARQEPMRGRFSAEGEIRPLFDLAIGGERSLSGFVRGQGTLGGTLAQPRASGNVSVERGRFEDGATGLDLRDLGLSASFSEHEVRVADVQANDGSGGRLSGSGDISLLRDGVSSFRLDLNDFRLIDNEMATASATGQATINRDANGKVKLSGKLTINEANVAAQAPTPSGVVPMDVVEIHRPPGLAPGLPPKPAAGPAWALDVDLKAPRRIYLRGRGLDVEFSLDAHVGGTTAAPLLTGTAHVVRGDYEFAGKRFDFDDRSVIYLSTNPEDIRLQLDATRDDPTLTATVRIRGTAARPEITLASSPSLPQDEILSAVLFGRSASQLSTVEAAQLAAALSTMAGGGGLDIMGNLRTFAGLDRLAFGGTAESGVTVSGGKYIGDDLYVELTGGGREGPSAQVEWQVRKHLAIISRFAGQAGNKIAVRWRRDY